MSTLEVDNLNGVVAGNMTLTPAGGGVVALPAGSTVGGAAIATSDPSRGLLSKTTGSSAVASIAVTAFDNATYDYYQVEFDDLECSSSGTGLLVRVSNDGGSTYISSGGNYAYVSQGITTTGAGANVGGDANNEWQMSSLGME